ncbi:hypothetical protein QVD17_06772 [Tagetes erecta]|uniref:RNA-directed DNA polymerase, eukaryota n=1 Tax=Tagetes erecta TaxID=13708 RepID=A0AAD8LMF2_TARER|nr:hypothetical protein QVD17_06772 [Tagetes erecta]
MGDSNVESSSLARKLLKIDGNPRVNLLRGSSKGNDASKTNSSLRHPVRGAAVDSKMTINPKGYDHTADVIVHPARGEAHTANSHTASVSKEKTDMARVIMDNDYMEKASDDITKVIHESNAVASLDEERFLKQKAKVHWLAEGDANTKFFHNTLKCRNHRARIDVITDSNGILHEGKEVPKAFVDHYVGFLGKEEAVIMPITQELFDVRIDQAIFGLVGLIVHIHGACPMNELVWFSAMLLVLSF